MILFTFNDVVPYNGDVLGRRRCTWKTGGTKYFCNSRGFPRGYFRWSTFSHFGVLRSKWYFHFQITHHEVWNFLFTLMKRYDSFVKVLLKSLISIVNCKWNRRQTRVVLFLLVNSNLWFVRNIQSDLNIILVPQWCIHPVQSGYWDLWSQVSMASQNNLLLFYILLLTWVWEISSHDRIRRHKYKNR